MDTRNLVRDQNLFELQKLAHEDSAQFDDTLWYPAITGGNLEVCKLLTETGVSPHRTRYDRTPLHMAAYAGKTEIVIWLLGLDVDPNVTDAEGYAAMDLAFEFSNDVPHCELVDALLNAGTEISIWTAVRMGDVDRCISILELTPEKLESRSGISLTPLMVAARMNNLDIAEYLITNGANVNATSGKRANGDGGNSSLWDSTQGTRPGRENMVKLLIKHGARIDTAGEHGWTALHMAAQWNHPESVAALLHNGADMNCLDADDKTPLQIAHKYESQSVIDLLSDAAPT